MTLEKGRASSPQDWGVRGAGHGFGDREVALAVAEALSIEGLEVDGGEVGAGEDMGRWKGEGGKGKGSFTSSA
jgi:hypothetical protein